MVGTDLETKKSVGYVLLLEASVSRVDIRFLGRNLWAGQPVGGGFHELDCRENTGNRELKGRVLGFLLC